MQNSKLLEILRTLQARQVSRFGEFLRSPYFNKNEDNVLFFNHLQKYSPDFYHKNLEKGVVVKQLKLGRTLDEKSLAYLMSQLTKLLETFLAIEHLQSDDFEMPLALMEQYHRLSLSRHGKAIADSMDKNLSNFPFRNAAFYRRQLDLKRLLYEQSDPNHRGFSENLQQAADALDVYFTIEKMRLACEMLNLRNTLNLEYRLDLEEVIQWASAAKFHNEPAVQIYLRLVLLLGDSADTGLFEEVKKLLLQHGHLFEEQELKQLYGLLLNYCTRRINRFNEMRFSHEYLEINQSLLENGLIFENGQLSPWRYSNLVSVGLKTGQGEWAFRFIHQFKNKLPSAHAENLYRYNLGQYYYHQKDLGRAQEQLIQVEFSDVLVNVSVRSLLIKIYFDLGETELLLSYLEATRIFLLRNKLLDGQIKQQLKKFVELCAKMARSEAEPEKLKELLENLPPARGVMHRDWLVEKLQERVGAS